MFGSTKRKKRKLTKKPKAPKESEASQAIPFDEDEPRAKVGTTDGF